MKDETKGLKLAFLVLKSRKRISLEKPFPVKPSCIRSSKKDEYFLEITKLDLKLILGRVDQIDFVAIEDSSVVVDQRLNARIFFPHF